MNSPNLKSIKICTVHGNAAIETTHLVRNWIATSGEKSWKCFQKKDLFHRTALWPLHWKWDTRSRPTVVGIYGGYGCVQATHTRALKNVGFSPWLLKLLMVVPARKLQCWKSHSYLHWLHLFSDCHVEISPRCGLVIPAVGASDAQPLALLGLWLCAPLCSEKGSLWEGTSLPCYTSHPQADSRFPYIRMKD